MTNRDSGRNAGNGPGARSTWPVFVTATAMLAQFVASKATRDAYFLSNFPASDLPAAMIGAGFATIAGTVVASRLLARFGPARVAPFLFAASAVLLLAIQGLGTSSPRASAAALYLHVALFGPLVISGFWSLLNERFDPHEAKSTLARVAAFAALGGVLGGVGANLISAWVGLENVLFALALMHAGCGVGIFVVGRDVDDEAGHEGAVEVASGLAVLRRSSYLQRMAGLVVIAAVVDALLDYAFKAAAAEEFEADRLIAFFGLYYTVTGVLTFTVQAGLGERVLRRFGLAGAMSALPASVIALGTMTLFWPRLSAIVATRAVESVFSNSLYSSGFQLLYTPLAPGDKRPAKPYVDVAAQRAGGIVGGAAIMIGLAVVPGLPLAVVIGAAVVVACAGLAMVVALHGGYVRELERSLRAGTLHLSAGKALDATTAHTLAGTGLAVDRTELLEQIRSLRAEPGERDAAGRDDDGSGGETEDGTTKTASLGATPSTATVASAGLDVEDALHLERARGLLEGDAGVVTGLLRTGRPDPRLASLVIPLLARSDLGDTPIRHLQKLSTRIQGQLLDALFDIETPLDVRRALPRCLERCPGAAVLPRLSAAFIDPDPLVRLRATQTAVRLIERAPALRFDRDEVHRWLEAALDFDDAAFAKAFDPVGPKAMRSVFGAALDDQARSPKLELAFTVLVLGQPLEVVRAGIHGIEAGAGRLRGTALEYLETILPAALFRRFFELVKRRDESPPVHHEPAARERIAAELLETSRGLERPARELRDEVGGASQRDDDD